MEKTKNNKNINNKNNKNINNKNNKNINNKNNKHKNKNNKEVIINKNTPYLCLGDEDLKVY